MAGLAVQQQTFAGENFVAIPLMTETSSGNAPGASDLERWQERHGFSGPVPLLADPGWGIFESFVGPNSNSFGVLIGPDMRIAAKTTSAISDAEITAVLQ